MSENLHELCCLLVEEFYGTFHKRLFSQLTYHGRLSASQVAQKCHLPLRQVKSGLCTLIQSRLAHYHMTPEGASTYQANTTAAYELLRGGRLIDLARSDLGELAAVAVSETILLGFATTSELEISTLDVVRHMNARRKHPANGTNPTNSIENGTSKGVQLAIEQLLEHGYLTRVRPAHFQTTFDAREDVRKQILGSQTSQAPRSKKAEQELESQIDSVLRTRTSTQVAEAGYVPDLQSNNKRSLDISEDQPNQKKQRLNNGSSGSINGTNSSSTMFTHPNHAVIVTVNFSNIVSHIRNQTLLRRVKMSLGTTCGEVLAEVLSQVPVTTESWSSNSASNAIDIHRIRDNINENSRLPVSNGYHHNGVEQTNGVHVDDEDAYFRDKTSFSDVDKSIALMQEGEFEFLQGSQGEEWYIDKWGMDKFVRNQEILRLMSDRLQPPALRITRMLMAKGKLDEKSLQELGLLGAKELRQTLAQLKQVGFADLQEVPRESQRQPNRTIFLWFYDPGRVQRVLLEGLYKSMTRLMQRLHFERKKVGSTLEKIERSDVQGNEDQIMSTAELRVLRRWQRMEQWLLGELDRLDSSVALLRDL